MIRQYMVEYKCFPPLKLKLNMDRPEFDKFKDDSILKSLLVTVDKIHEYSDITYYHIVELDSWENSILFEYECVTDLEDEYEVKRWNNS